MGHRFKQTRFIKDETGNMAILFAVSISVLLLGAGSAFDIAQASKAKRIAQIAADSMALSASIAESHDNQDRFIDGQRYSYEEIGGTQEDFTNSLTGSVALEQRDGSGTRYIRSTVSGSYQTAFMSMFGMKTIDVTATAEASYAEDKKTPASVFLVLDNSGSMNFDDRIDTVTFNDYDEAVSTVAGAEPRLDGLKATVKDLMDNLTNIISAIEPGEPRALRTAMFPYESEIVTSTKIDPKWGVISDSDIDAMSGFGGTNSFNPLNETWQKLQLEPDIHKAESGVDESLDFVIFMTDGVNDLCVAEDMPGHYHWRRYFWGYGYYITEERPSYEWLWEKVWVDDGEETEQVCAATSPFDQTTLDTCTAMKAAGVTIYTIGYSLEPGRYHRNDGVNNYANTDYDRYHYVLESGPSNTAFSLLQGCASSSEHFTRAEDADALAEAFEDIGTKIVKEVIRIKK